ncbi:MAG: hypothetical protein FJ045_03410 [Crenarchaeota archaeon]|nr:hypothetical protein [Thermoproteota archaeon]
MNSLSRKLRKLEGNVVELPEDEEIILSINDDAEWALHAKANEIRKQFKDKVAFLHDPALTFEQINAKAEEVQKEISEQEWFIINRSEELVRFRLMRLIYKQFAPTFSEYNKDIVWKRIVWFFSELDKLNGASAIEDSEWNHNRNEDDLAFDDLAWWDRLDVKIREFYPAGVFTEESWRKCEEFFDEKEAEAIRAYWREHPEEFERLTKRLESLKNGQG